MAFVKSSVSSDGSVLSDLAMGVSDGDGGNGDHGDGVWMSLNASISRLGMTSVSDTPLLSISTLP